MAYCHDLLLIHSSFLQTYNEHTSSFLGSKGQYIRVINCINGVLEAPDELTLQFVHRNPA